VAQKAADLPGWIWLPWVPQLMTSLQRPEVAVARRILSAAASSFPQQLYWHVRPSMLSMKDAAVKAVQDAKAQANARSAAAAAAAAQQAEGADGGAAPEGGASTPAAGGASAEKKAKAAGGEGAAAPEPVRPPSPQIEKPIEVRCGQLLQAVTDGSFLRNLLALPCPRPVVGPHVGWLAGWLAGWLTGWRGTGLAAVQLTPSSSDH
jgi:transformation/transcription domain-associated protein